MGGAQMRRQRSLVDRKAMVLAGDADATAIQVFDRMVGAVVAEFHFESLGTTGQCHDLMAQANAECRCTGIDQGAGCRDGVVARLRIARAVAQENTIGLQRERISRAGLRWHHRDFAATRAEHAQDVGFDAEVIGHHMPTRLTLFAIACAQRPFRLGPRIGLIRADDTGQIQPRHGRRCARRVDSDLDGGSVRRLPGQQGQNAAILSAVGAQMAGELARVQVGNGDRAGR